MINIIFKRRNSKLTSFVAQGHSGYAESGSDIVCSAVSTATQMTVLGLKLLNQNPKVKISDGFMQVDLQKSKIDEGQNSMILLLETLKQISKDYFKYVKLEVKDEI